MMGAHSLRDWLWPTAVVGLLAGVALGRGGYSSGAILLLELGAALLWLVLLWGFGSELDATALERLTEQRRLHRRRSWFSVFRRPTVEVEILPPRAVGADEDEGEDYLERYGRERCCFVAGRPFPRAWLSAPLLLLTFWIGVSVVPLPAGWLRWLSPEAARLVDENARLSGDTVTTQLSVQPYRTLEDLWLWLSLLALFYVSLSLARRAQRAVRMSTLMVGLGTTWGAYGLVEWLLASSGRLGGGPSSIERATASFGNPNHYGAFLSVLFICGLGWLGYQRARMGPTRTRRGSARMEQGASMVLMLLPLLVIALGIVASMSRAVITFLLLACGAFLLLSGSRAQRRSQLPVFLALGLGLAAIVGWIAFEPLVTRFAILEEQLRTESTRFQVWKDSLGAVWDYHLTGSGLGTFRYIAPIYRTFGGRVFYSWAHNDYLQLLIELGLPGLLSLAWLAVSLLRRWFMVRRSLESDPPLLELHRGYSAALIFVSLHAATDFSLHLPANFALVAVVLGVVVGLSPGEKAAREAGREPDHP